MNNNRKYSLQDEKNRLILSCIPELPGAMGVCVVSKSSLNGVNKKIRNPRFVWNNYPFHPGREVKKIAEKF